VENTGISDAWYLLCAGSIRRDQIILEREAAEREAARAKQAEKDRKHNELVNAMKDSKSGSSGGDNTPLWDDLYNRKLGEIKEEEMVDVEGNGLN
jgi:hypothetical protein